MDALELAQFVIECLDSMPEHDRQFFFEELQNAYCIGPYGCGKPCGECNCEPLHY